MKSHLKLCTIGEELIKIKFKKIGPRSYLYDIDSLVGNVRIKQNVIYCRVSNTKQKKDLERQEEILREFCIKNGFQVHKVFKDIASGMNENRKGFNQLVDLVTNNKVQRVFITYKDRLTRFGFDYFVKFFDKFGTKIIVLNEDKEISFEDELVQDLISIIHHFSMKMYSHRRKQLTQLKKELEKNANC